MVTNMYGKDNPKKSKRKTAEKKTMAALKSGNGRAGGPTAMRVMNPNRLSEGKYKGTR